jgi:two-component system, cell cycle response regulator CpdR
MVRILLADDEAPTRDLVRRALESDGHSVTVTQDGPEALENILTGTFDLMVTDVHMPGLDGLALAERAGAAHPELCVLFMSGFPEELAKAKAIKVKRVGVLSKPFTLEQMKAAVRALLG